MTITFELASIKCKVQLIVILKLAIDTSYNYYIFSAELNKSFADFVHHKFHLKQCDSELRVIY